MREQEVALNRRFAPDVYLGLGEFRSPDADTPEPLVVMRRMPAERRLSLLVSQGADVDEALRTVARLLAARHADALRGPDISFTQVRELTEDVRLLDGVAETERSLRRYLAGGDELFDRRVEQGRVVDGHGDLLAQDIFCLDDGPRVLDCLEFDDRLRSVDGLDDAAFLAMDLEQAGAPEAAAYFLAQYGEYSGDPAPPSLWHHYVAYRAFARAKVSLIQAAQGARGAEAAARRLLTATLRHLRTSAVGLTLVGGLPGSGKSTLSGALADRLGVTLLSSDRLRTELAGIGRLRRRAPGASDATPEVAKAMAGAEPPCFEEAGPVDTGGPLEAAVIQAMAAVRPYGSGQAPVFRRPCMEPD